MYQTDISDRDWIIYDMIGNLGWIACFIGFGRNVCAETRSALWIGEGMMALFILMGLCELIGERIAGLDRLLSKRRLYRGFGLIMAASFTGALVSLADLMVSGWNVNVIMMCAGGLVCGWFSRLLFVRYTKVSD